VPLSFDGASLGVAVPGQYSLVPQVRAVLVMGSRGRPSLVPAGPSIHSSIRIGVPGILEISGKPSDRSIATRAVGAVRGSGGAAGLANLPFVAVGLAVAGISPRLVWRISLLVPVVALVAIAVAVVHSQLPALHHTAVQELQSLISVPSVLELHEAVSWRISGNPHVGDHAKAAELLSKVVP
jgi:hypothetical protein